jgi:PPOX class probable F420-dependent enzyme
VGMAGGRCARLSELPGAALTIVREARRGVLTTIDGKGRPHAVPVCYVIRDEEIVTPIDAKPKSGKPLGRRKNLERDPTATFLVDRWSEDWSRLGWTMIRGKARFEESGEKDDLVERYPQYEEILIEDDLIIVQPEEIAWWLWES